jgi:hypothetical protein
MSWPDNRIAIFSAQAWKNYFTENFGGYFSNFRYLGQSSPPGTLKTKKQTSESGSIRKPFRRPAFMGYTNYRLKNAEICRGWPEPAVVPTVAGSTSNKS